jgi:haloalkane dehalogenase
MEVAMSDATIPAADTMPRKRIALEGSEMAYAEVGTGAPMVFLHGNPTSSYLWRNIIAHLSGMSRCLAPDLIGMGASGKASDGSYRFVDHARYLDAWFERLDLKHDVTLVIHDWGSALGFHWANRNRSAVKGIAYMEAIVAPLKWDDWPEAARKMFQALRGSGGEEMILQKNLFVERILPASVLRPLSGAEMEAYRKPFIEPGETRRPMLTWPRQIPIDGDPADVTAIVNDYAAWLADSSIPKLFINAEPGSILTGRQRESCRRWPNQREVTVKGSHFIQEDSPEAIGQAIAEWCRSI